MTAPVAAGWPLSRIEMRQAPVAHRRREGKKAALWTESPSCVFFGHPGATLHYRDAFIIRKSRRACQRAGGHLASEGAGGELQEMWVVLLDWAVG